MARVKAGENNNKISPTREAEVRKTLESTKENYFQYLKDLSRSKREFSSTFADAMEAEFVKTIPSRILNMKATDFVSTATARNNEIITEAVTPPNASRVIDNYKLLKTPSGTVRVPSRITPKVDKSRALKTGEVLFSINGTPVLSEETTDNFKKIVKDRGVFVENLLQQEDEKLSPETRKIVHKLKSLMDRNMAKV